MKKKGIDENKIILRLGDEIELADWAVRMDEETRNTPGRISARFLIEVKESLLRRMEETGTTQQQLADKMFVKQSYISKFFNHSNNISVNTLVKVANALGLDVETPRMVSFEEKALKKVKAADLQIGLVCPSWTSHKRDIRDFKAIEKGSVQAYAEYSGSRGLEHGIPAESLEPYIPSEAVNGSAVKEGSNVKGINAA